MVRGPVAVQEAPVFSNELDNAFHKLQTVGGTGYDLPSKDNTMYDYHGEKVPYKYEDLYYNPSFSSLSVEQVLPVDTINIIPTLPVQKLTVTPFTSKNSGQEFDISSLLELVTTANKEGASNANDFVIPEPPLQFISDEHLSYSDSWDSTATTSDDPFITGFYSDEVKPSLAVPADKADLVRPTDLPSTVWEDQSNTALSELDFMLPPPAKKPATPPDPSLADWFPELTQPPAGLWPLTPSPASPPENITPFTPPSLPDSPRWSHNSPRWSHDSPQWSHDSPMSTTADALKPEVIVVAERVDATSERGGGDRGKFKNTVLFGQQEDNIIHKLLVPTPGVSKKPITRDKLVAMPVEEFNQLLELVHLSEIEVAFMKEWRRRGKNKGAAQVARKRKREELSDLDQEVEALRQQKAGLELRYDRLRSNIATLKENAMAAEDKIYGRYSVKHGQAVSRETHTIHVTDDEKLVLVPKISSQIVMF